MSTKPQLSSDLPCWRDHYFTIPCVKKIKFINYYFKVIVWWYPSLGTEDIAINGWFAQQTKGTADSH